MNIGNVLNDDYRVWVHFIDDIEVQIRFLSMKETTRIVEGATKVSWDKKHLKQETFDVEEYNRLTGRAAVCGWKGMEKEDGSEFPYTPENCDLLMSKWFDFAKFVNQSCTDIQALVEADRAEAEKNSVSTSGA